MIWFLLYPVRGTSRPPRLSDNHPIRRAFYSHGLFAAQHWLITMLFATTVGVVLSYPTVFLSENPTAGFTSVPHHVWTTAKPIDRDQNVLADVEMRQVWVHGSYMQALDKEVLKSALVIQQTLVDGEQLASSIPELSETLSSGALSWGYHSPLMYWNNSAEAIDQDDDIVRTVNEQAGRSSSLNVALRPASVLAGKSFHQRKLLAADALVLTLLNKVEDHVGSKWQDKMHSLEGRACENCTLFPPHGEISRNRLYEFSFTPLSFRENIALGFAYGCMALYVILSLRRLRAFHSRFGLVVTAITQITLSVLASFTVCGMLKINLATIPQNAYPFIVLVIGLENMFRIINAILAYPPTMATDLRIANALGDIGPLSVATAVQNIIILWLLAIVVSPGVKAFCAFAAIATLFDSFFLLTFFVAVLNVDIRRFELQDSLARSNLADRSRRRSPVHRTWLDAMMHGRLPFSTRMAGSVVTTTFILSLNYHFFEHEEKPMSLRHLFGLFLGQLGDNIPDLADYDSLAPPPMNVTLTPDEWIRMQDFDTAREVMRLVKPGAQNFVIRIFSPLIVILSGADRTGVPRGIDVLSSALRGFALHHFYPFAVVVIFSVTFVVVLMNFLLYSDPSDVSDARLEADEALIVQNIALTHKLDIVKMAGSRKGHFVTVGLDRTISVALYDRSQNFYTIDNLPLDFTRGLAWPLHDIFIDSTGELLAFRCADDKVMMYSRRSRRLLEGALPYPDDHPPVLFTFERLAAASETREHLLLVTSAGRMSTMCVEDEHTASFTLSETPLLGAKVIHTEKQGARLMAVSERGAVLSYAYGESTWTLAASSDTSLWPIRDQSPGAVSIEPVPGSGTEILMISATSGINFVNCQTLEVLASTRAPAPTNELQPVLGQVTKCNVCGSLALTELGMIMESLDGDAVTLVVKNSEQRPDGMYGICINATRSNCHRLEDAARTQTTINAPGAWQTLPSQSVLGLRKKRDLQMPSANNNKARSRRPARKSGTCEQRDDEWEAYVLSLPGDIHSVSITSGRDGYSDSDNSLYVTKPGPAVRLNAKSIAVAFGNSVKVLRANGSSIARTELTAAERRGSIAGSRKRQGSGKKLL